MALDDQRLLAAIDRARIGAYGSADSSELADKRTEAIERYLGLNRMPAPQGRSQVVSRDVYETIQTMLPPLVRIFASSSDEVCKCVPVGPEDEAGAEQTTAVLSHVVTQQNPWEQIAADWIHNALLLMNGYAMAYWDSSEKRVRDVYKDQSEDQLALLLQDKGVTLLQQSSKPDEQGNAEAQAAYEQAMQQFQQIMPQWEQAAQQAQAQGQPPPPQPQQPQPPQPMELFDVVVERVEEEGKVCVSVLPPEHCIVSALTPNWLLKDCPFFEFRQQKTIADLMAMGLEVPEDISDDPDLTPEDQARNRLGESNQWDEDGEGVMRSVWARMIWIRADVEDDGVSRLYYVIAVGRTILFVEPTGRIPVSSMVAQPLPHRHIGMSVAETVADIEDIKTAIKRGGLDNLYQAMNQRHAISSRVNVADMLNNAPGAMVRMIDDSLPGEGHILPMGGQFAFGEILGGLEYFDQERQNRSGAMRGAAGLEANAMNKAAVGTTVAMQNASAMRVEHIARTMAPAVEELFSIVHEIISKHANKPLAVKLKGEWTLVDPQAWRTKRDIRISVGVGAGNKESMMQQLGQMFGAQLQLAPFGVAKAENMYATVFEMTKLSGFANPNRFWTDPANREPMPQQPSPEQIKAQSAMQIKQMELQQSAQQFQTDMQLKALANQQQHEARIAEIQKQYELQASNDQRDAERERVKAIYEAQINAAEQENKRQIAVLQAEVDTYKANLDSQTKLAIAQLSAAPPIDLGPVQAALDALAQHLASPVEIVRDPNTGRALGVKRGGKTMAIARGPDGRASGMQ